MHDLNEKASSESASSSPYPYGHSVTGKNTTLTNVGVDGAQVDTITLLFGIPSNDDRGIPRGYYKYWGLDGEIKTSKPKQHHGRVVDIDSLHALYQVLYAQRNERRACAVRGNYKQPLNGGTVCRQKMLLDDTPHYWVVFDIDEADMWLCIYDWRTHPKEVAQQVIDEYFPPACHGHEFFYYYSSSQGFKDGGERLRIGMWFDRKVTGHEVMQWIHSHHPTEGVSPFDTALCQRQQPIYVADPMLAEGTEDPLPGGARWGFVEGDGQPVMFELGEHPYEYVKQAADPSDEVLPPPSEDEMALAEAALQVLDPNDFPDYKEGWLRIVMAAHSAGLDMDVVNDWCMRGDKYEPGELEKRWRGFSRGGGVGIGTLIKLANDHSPGWERPLPEVLLKPIQGEGAESARNEGGQLILPSPNFTYVQSGEMIFTQIAKRKDLFWRGGGVMELTPKGLMQIDAAHFVSRLDRYGTVLRHVVNSNGGIEIRPRRCPKDAAAALLVSHEAAGLLPNIQRVVRCPVITPDGEVLHKGYHEAAGGTLVTGDVNIVEVPLEQAAEDLLALLTDFDFVSPGDKSRAVASFISPIMAFGGFFVGPPAMDLAEADKSQSGKTYRQEMARAICDEQAYPISQNKGGVGSLDESIAQALVSGKPFITLDNFRGNINSAKLEMILTWSGEVSARVPHKGEISVDASGVTFQLSSNGLETTPDLANRAAITRIRKRPHGYRFTRWEEGDVQAHIKANQPYYLSCVFSVIKAWISAGKPGIRCQHERRYWAEPLNWMVREVFGLEDLMEGHEAARSRISSKGGVWLRELTLKMEGLGLLGVGYTAADLAEISTEEDIRIPGLEDWMRTDSAGKARRIGSIMKQVFGRDDVKRFEAEGGEIEMIDIDALRVCRKQFSERVQYAASAQTRKVWRYCIHKRHGSLSDYEFEAAEEDITNSLNSW